MGNTWRSGRDNRDLPDGVADSTGTVGKSWTQPEIDAQIDRERRKGLYWHPLKGSMDATAYALLSAADKALCLAPIP